MPRGSKSAYSPKQRRKARHIEKGYEEQGVSAKRAAKLAWATVNKQDGGALGATKKKQAKKSAARAKPAAKKPGTKRTVARSA